MSYTNHRRDHSRLAQHIIVVALALAVALGAVAPRAGAGGTDTPREQLDAFTFSFALSVAPTTAPTNPVVSVQTEGTYVAPDRSRCDATMGIGGVEFTTRSVSVGKRAWSAAGGRLRPSRPDDVDLGITCPGAADFWDAFPVWVPESAHGVDDGARERIDLLSGDHDVVADIAGFDSLPEGISVERADLWRIPDRPVVVGFEMTLVATTDDACREIFPDALIEIPVPCRASIVMHLDRVNDRRLRVKVPA